MTAYQPGIPTGRVKLLQDYASVQANFQQLDTTYGTDHVAYSVAANNGYHTTIHMVPPSTIASNGPTNQPINGYTANGFGQLLSPQINDGINSDEALYFLSGGNRLMQMTRNFLPTPIPTAAFTHEGATFLPGGFILNWGYFNSTGGAGQTVTLTQKFTGNFFNAQATMMRNSSNVDTIYCTTTPGVAPGGGITTITFRDTSSGNPFFWYALGN